MTIRRLTLMLGLGLPAAARGQTMEVTLLGTGSLVALAERRPALLETLLPRTRATYAGRVVLGEDLMSFIVGDTIEIRHRHAGRR